MGALQRRLRRQRLIRVTNCHIVQRFDVSIARSVARSNRDQLIPVNAKSPDTHSLAAQHALGRQQIQIAVATNHLATDTGTRRHLLGSRTMKCVSLRNVLGDRLALLPDSGALS